MNYHEPLKGKKYLNNDRRTIEITTNRLTGQQFKQSFDSVLTIAVEKNVNQGKDNIKPKESKKRKVVTLAAKLKVEKEIINPIDRKDKQLLRRKRDDYFKAKRAKQLANKI